MVTRNFLKLFVLQFVRYLNFRAKVYYVLKQIRLLRLGFFRIFSIMILPFKSAGKFKLNSPIYPKSAGNFKLNSPIYPKSAGKFKLKSQYFKKSEGKLILKIPIFQKARENSNFPKFNLRMSNFYLSLFNFFYFLLTWLFQLFLLFFECLFFSISTWQ